MAVSRKQCPYKQTNNKHINSMPILVKSSRNFHGFQAGDDQSLNLYMVFLCIVNALNKYLFNISMNEYILLCLSGEVFPNFHQLESP